MTKNDQTTPTFSAGLLGMILTASVSISRHHSEYRLHGLLASEVIRTSLSRLLSLDLEPANLALENRVTSHMHISSISHSPHKHDIH